MNDFYAKHDQNLKTRLFMDLFGPFDRDNEVQQIKSEVSKMRGHFTAKLIHCSPK